MVNKGIHDGGGDVDCGRGVVNVYMTRCGHTQLNCSSIDPEYWAWLGRYKDERLENGRLEVVSRVALSDPLAFQWVFSSSLQLLYLCGEDLDTHSKG